MRAIAALLGVLVVAAAAAAGLAWRGMHEPFKGYPGEAQLVDIPPGTSPAGIGERLVAAGVVRDRYLFRAALWWTGRARTLKAGEYRFDSPRTVLDVIDVVARGEVYARRITFPEGLIVQEMAAIYADRGFGAAADFTAAAKEAALVQDLDPQARDLEGYLFPDTYAVGSRAAARDLIAMMVDRFRSAYGPALRAAAERQGLSTREVVTLASLVEKESAQPDERPKVAAVYRNRLRIGMGMQADPTVVYALRLAGRYDGNIRREDLRIDSPYNTYRYRGLPPGPIASPGLESLEATLAPADVPYLYFVSRNDGTHVFSSTLQEHNRNVQEFQVLYFQRARRAAAAPRR